MVWGIVHYCYTHITEFSVDATRQFFWVGWGCLSSRLSCSMSKARICERGTLENDLQYRKTIEFVQLHGCWMFDRYKLENPLFWEAGPRIDCPWVRSHGVFGPFPFVMVILHCRSEQKRHSWQFESSTFAKLCDSVPSCWGIWWISSFEAPEQSVALPSHGHWLWLGFHAVGKLVHLAYCVCGSKSKETKAFKRPLLWWPSWSVRWVVQTTSQRPPTRPWSDSSLRGGVEAVSPKRLGRLQCFFGGEAHEDPLRCLFAFRRSRCLYVHVLGMPPAPAVAYEATSPISWGIGWSLFGHRKHRVSCGIGSENNMLFTVALLFAKYHVPNRIQKFYCIVFSRLIFVNMRDDAPTWGRDEPKPWNQARKGTSDTDQVFLVFCCCNSQIFSINCFEKGSVSSFGGILFGSVLAYLTGAELGEHALYSVLISMFIYIYHIIYIYIYIWIQITFYKNRHHSKF